MAFVLADFVKETTGIVGTGTMELDGAPSGAQKFVEGIGNGNETYYTVRDATSWETGVGTVTAGTPDTLSRDRVIASSNAGNKVAFLSGTKTVTCQFNSEAADLLVLLGLNESAAPTLATILAALDIKRIRQYVSDTLTTAYSNATSTPSDTGLTVTITPKSSTSKILILAFYPCSVNLNQVSGSDAYGFVYLEKDGATTVTQVRKRITGTANSGGNNLGQGGYDAMAALDTPGDTSAHTYKIRAFTDGQTTTTIYVNEYGGSGTQVSLIVALELDP